MGQEGSELNHYDIDFHDNVNCAFGDKHDGCAKVNSAENYRRASRSHDYGCSFLASNCNGDGALKDIGKKICSLLRGV